MYNKLREFYDDDTATNAVSIKNVNNSSAFSLQMAVYKHYNAPAEWSDSPKSLDSLPVFMPRWDETRLTLTLFHNKSSALFILLNFIFVEKSIEWRVEGDVDYLNHVNERMSRFRLVSR